MKKVVYLFCLFSVLISCKQTQLTSNYNKRSIKIYTKAPLKYKDFDIVSNEKRASAPAKSSPIIKSTKNQFYSNKLTNKDELFTDLDSREINGVSLGNCLHKRTLRVDSILKSNIVNSDSTLMNTSSSVEVLSLFKKKGLLNKIYLRLNKKFKHSEKYDPEPKFHWSLKATFLFFSLALIMSWFALFDGASTFVVFVGILSVLLYTFFSYIARKEITNNPNYKGRRLANILYYIGIASIYIFAFAFVILLLFILLLISIS